MSDKTTRLDEIESRLEAEPDGPDLCPVSECEVCTQVRDARALLAVVRDVQTVHARYFSTDVPPDHEDAGCEPEDVWRFDRDLRAALAPMNETTEETR